MIVVKKMLFWLLLTIVGVLQKKELFLFFLIENAFYPNLNFTSFGFLDHCTIYCYLLESFY